MDKRVDTGQRIGIVGAGAWGLSCALALGEAGHANVHVWERTQPGAGATSLAAGLVSTHLRLESDIRLVLETRQRLERLRQWGRDHERPSAESAYHAAGSLTFVLRSDEYKLQQLRERIRRAGAEAQLLSPGDFQGRPWPLKPARDSVGLYSPKDGYVEAGDLTDLLQGRIRDLGLQLSADRRVRLLREGGTCVGVESSEGPHRLDAVVVAAGAWSKALMAEIGLALPIKGYRTQLAQVEFPHDAQFPIYHDFPNGVYGRPDGGQRILVGDGTELVESDPERFNRSTDRSFVERVASATTRRWRGGESARLRTGWAGLCVATPDRNPLIGPHPEIESLHVVVGDNGFGVMRCLALGQLAADRIRGQRPPGSELYDCGRLEPDQDFPIREGFEL